MPDKINRSSEDISADLKKAKEHIFRARLYRVMAYLLAFSAFLIAVFIYNTLGHGKPIHVVQNPVLIAVLLLPFVPAFFLAMLSKKKRAKATKILKPLYAELGDREKDALGE